MQTELVVFSFGRWEGRRDRPRMLAEAFAEHSACRCVHYVALLPALRQSLRLRIPLPQLFVNQRTTVTAKLSVTHTPVSLPYLSPGLAGIAYSINCARARRHLANALLPSVCGNPAIALVHHPLLWPIIQPFKSVFKLLIYDVMDDWHSLIGAGLAKPFHLDEIEMQLIEAADLVTCVSSDLLTTVKPRAKDALLIRNAVSGRFFSPLEAGERERVPLQAGFIGTFGHWIDLDLLSFAARELPEVAFQFYGPVETDISILRGLPNVSLHGPVPYEQVPKLIDTFDICLLPFRLSATGIAADPIKVYEYLARGKPVVSTQLPELGWLQDHVELCPDRDDFVTRIKTHAASDYQRDLFAAHRRQDFVRDQSWSQRTDALLQRALAHLERSAS